MIDIKAPIAWRDKIDRVRENLLKYAAAEVPRYTSYPTAAQFHDGVGEDDYRRWLSEVDPRDALSLYIHVPFCWQLCWYCGCHTTIVHDYSRVSAYVALLHTEIDMLAKVLPEHGGFSHVHFGGGTPTILSPGDFTRLVACLKDRLGLRANAEVAVEADPRTLSETTVHALAQAGVTRVSLGVQDFAPAVQERINRVQPLCTVAGATRALRAAGLRAVNFDLMYGLPGQTEKSAEASASLTASLSPDRVAVFGYAHVPWFKKHQCIFRTEELPGVAQRFAQAAVISDRLTSEGYVEVGFDHFALPADGLARAARARSLRRNFQGYTDDTAPVLLGLGASSIGCLPSGYVQNAPGLDRYRHAIEAGRLPVARGAAVGADDRLRRDVIEALLCHLDADVGELCEAHGVDVGTLDAAFEALGELAADGLITLEGRRVVVLAQGRRFLRSVAACFDAYWKPQRGQHSAAV